MESEKLREVVKIPLKKKNLPEKRKYRRHLWNMLFIELLLQKLQEKEQQEAAQGVILQEEGGTSATVCELTLQMDRQYLKGGGGIPIMGRDSLELSLYCFESMISCENYACLADSVKRAGKLASDRLLCEAGSIMQEYYDGRLDVMMLAVIYRRYCYACVDRQAYPGEEDFVRQAERTDSGDYLGEWTDSECKQDFGLAEVYECFARANARKAVQMNRYEGKRLVEECGLSWAGTTYYNSYYYYLCGKIKALLQKITDEIAEECGVADVNFDKMETGTRFCMDGGLSFHGVFEWTQMQNNFPSRQYGMKDKEKMPPENFIYLYRNGYSETEKKGVRCLKKKVKNFILDRAYDVELWRSFCVCGGREYHNGESYLLEQKRTGKEDEKMYQQTMEFLDTFRLYRISGCVELLSVGKKQNCV